MKKIIISLLGLAFAFHVGFAQTTITGTVTNKKDGTPIAGALIQAKGKTVVTATSDPAGNYSIIVPADVKVLEAKVPGMTTKTQGIGKKQAIDFKMTSNKGKSGGKGKDVEEKRGKQTEKTNPGKKQGNQPPPPPPPPPAEKPTQSKGGKKK